MPINVWIWIREGRKKPVYIDERFMKNIADINTYLNAIMLEGETFIWSELPPCAEGWQSFKLVLLVKK